MNKTIGLITLLLFCIHLNGYGQIPEIVIEPCSDSEQYEPTIFQGVFRIDTIYERDSNYLIEVTGVDSISTNNSFLEKFLAHNGVRFTIISFKNTTQTNNDSASDTIHLGDIRYFTLSTPAWSLRGPEKWDDWSCSMSAKDPEGNSVKVPLPLIKTQLMLASELNGLQYKRENSKDEN